MTEYLEADGGKWSAFVLAAAVAWTSAPTPGLGKLFRPGVLVKTTRACRGEDSYLAGPPRRDLGQRGCVVIRIGWPPAWMDACSSQPVSWE